MPRATFWPLNMTLQRCSPPIAITPALKVACSNCKLRDLCLPVALPEQDLQRLDTLVTNRPLIKRGAALFRKDDLFKAIYVVRTGFFKNCAFGADGSPQIAGFLMAGEILGLDGIGTDIHTCDAIALEDSQVCTVPLDQLEQFSREFVPLQRHFHKIMSREILRDHEVMLMLGNMPAEKRVAAFLMNLLERLHARGFSSSEITLRMTRAEIGSYLGLKLETVSRAFAKLETAGLVSVQHRNIRVRDEAAMAGLIDTP